MPTYEYQCLQCTYRFEEFQKITDRPLLKCPRCGGKLKRLISGGAGLIFKGSGFYITDYKKKQQPKEETKAETPKPAKKTTASQKPDK